MSCYVDESMSSAGEEMTQEEAKRTILMNMTHIIFCDLTVGRSDDGMEPYSSEEVSKFIEENKGGIESAAKRMYEDYEEDGDLNSLRNPEMDWFSEYLYHFVTTRATMEYLTTDDEED
jgi:hypothetical protein